ncbi:hypothetical protein GCM10010278_37420 [Streptomyces melanogenes]|nr:hypothetical protein GCM10010278_37420 [Streptomyces melanogenes]
MQHTEITIKLTPGEALILSDWLERVQMTDLSRMVETAEPLVLPASRAPWKLRYSRARVTN